MSDFPESGPKDVCYWVNHELYLRNDSTYCLNAAVEESSLGERYQNGLLTQDQFIQSRLSPDDILIVSVGGNDIALKPSIVTPIHFMMLLFNPFPEWLYYFGLSHFVDLFKTKIEKFLQELTKNTKPKKVLVCMLYYFDLGDEAWPGAEYALSFAGYYHGGNPERLKRMIRLIFRRATSEIKVDGIRIVPVPLFEVLDGSDSKDYAYRVEPSSQGGHKMAKLLLKYIDE